MKKILINWLPIVAATLLITACSKEDNIDSNIPTPTENTIDTGNYVTVPLSVKVEENVCQSKMATIEAYGNMGKVVTRKFEPEDVDKIRLKVTGNGIFTSYLTLKYTTLGDREIYYFEGDIEVENYKLQDFKNGNITLTGSFYTYPEESTSTSQESLIDLVNHCFHEYKGSFRSNAGSIVLIDQLSYLAIKWGNCPNNPKSVRMKIDNMSKSFNLNSDGEIWIALEGSRRIEIEQFGLEAKVAEVGHIYNINKVTPENVQFAEQEHVMKVGETWTPTFIFTPTNCNVTSMDKEGWFLYDNYDDAVSFKNKDYNIDGTIIADAVGEATLEAMTPNRISAQCKIIVTAE